MLQDPDQERVRRAYNETVSKRAVEAERRLRWTVPRRQAFTNARLGEFLDFVRARSAWHRRRLRGIDLSGPTASDMSALPIMTKRDLHENWDEIVTDPELTLGLANRHLGSLSRDGFSFAMGRCVILATGGTTGVRSVLALDEEAIAAKASATVAHSTTSRPPDLALPAVPVEARLMALNPLHGSGASSAIRQGAAGDFVTVPPSTPMTELVAVLDDAQPDTMMGYGSMLHLVAVEALAGRLHIAPKIATNAGEPLLPETRALVADAFGIEARNSYVSSESYFGQSWRGSELLHLSEDTSVVELVDADNRPVPPGTPSAKLLLTNLANRLQPLIRYEITDEVTEAVIDPASDDPSQHPPGPWSGRWIHPPLGRSDDWFTYDGVVVHPHVFRSQLAAVPAVAEYRVTQTVHGAHIAVVAYGRVDAATLGSAVAAELRRVGLDSPAIHIETVESIGRHAASGKLRRFVPLP